MNIKQSKIKIKSIKIYILYYLFASIEIKNISIQYYSNFFVFQNHLGNMIPQNTKPLRMKKNYKRQQTRLII
jgi:hypothetical protein